MNQPLADRPAFQPLVKKLKTEGWLLLILGVSFCRDIHGIPEALKVLFSVDKNDLSSYEPVLSRYDVWIIHSGLWSIASFVILVFLIYRWSKLIRRKYEPNPQASESPNSEQTEYQNYDNHWKPDEVGDL